MEGFDPMIRKLTTGDYQAFQQMDTGIEDDYIFHIFPESVNQEDTYGFFQDGRLVSMAAITVFADRYVILGRVRTDRRYRGQGIATQLLGNLCRKVDARPDISWV